MRDVYYPLLFGFACLVGVWSLILWAFDILPMVPAIAGTVLSILFGIIFLIHWGGGRK